MSKHNSLKSNASVGGKRSVLKRFERVKLLKERGDWKSGRSPIGLSKTKHEGCFHPCHFLSNARSPLGFRAFSLEPPAP